MYSTQISCQVRAPRSAVYRALLDADAIAKWRVPAGTEQVVEAFEFESADPALGGTMTMTTRLTGAHAHFRKSSGYLKFSCLAG